MSEQDHLMLNSTTDLFNNAILIPASDEAGKTYHHCKTSSTDFLGSGPVAGAKKHFDSCLGLTAILCVILLSARNFKLSYDKVRTFWSLGQILKFLSVSHTPS